MNNKADWIAWTLQCILGMAVGAGIGWRWLPGKHSIAEHPVFSLVICGAALIGGGLASRLGDQLWLGDSYRMIPPDAPQQSSASKNASWWLCASGGVMIALSIYRQSTM